MFKLAAIFIILVILVAGLYPMQAHAGDGKLWWVIEHCSTWHTDSQGRLRGEVIAGDMQINYLAQNTPYAITQIHMNNRMVAIYHDENRVYFVNASYQSVIARLYRDCRA